MPLLSIWTGAWVGRAGLLAQAVAVLLMAPQIAGETRMLRVESRLTEWAGAIRWPVVVYKDSLNDLLNPKARSEHMGLERWLTLWLATTSLAYLVPYTVFLLFFVASGRAEHEQWTLAIITVIYTLATWLSMVGLVCYGRTQNDVVKSIALPFLMPVAIYTSIAHALSTLVANGLLLAALALVRVTTGQGRLPTIVLGTGISLFVLGTAGLFLATFG